MRFSMNFALNRWCDDAGLLSGQRPAGDALAALKWALSPFETPQPVALDLSGVAEITDDFVEGFFCALLAERLESYFGLHQVMVVGAEATVAARLREALLSRGVALPIAERTGR